ncbi:MAG: hypothetical protein RL657_1020 [Pseudomonadota bacterium]|jgi:hypothetical protein
MMKKIWAVVGVLWAVPLWAGDPVPHALPEYVLEAPELPDARELYQRTLDCWPMASHFKGEVSLEGRIGQRHEGWLYGSAYPPMAGQSASLVARLPLYSANELDREREREMTRRRRAAETVGHWLTQVADLQRIRQELGLMKAMERRARLRVLSGIVDSSEQVRYMERVAELDGQLLRHQGQMARSRLELLGFCAPERADALDRHLRAYMGLKELP